MNLTTIEIQNNIMFWLHVKTISSKRNVMYIISIDIWRYQNQLILSNVFRCSQFELCLLVALVDEWIASCFPVVLMFSPEVPLEYSVLVCGMCWYSLWALSFSLSTVLVFVRYACILLWPLIGEWIFWCFFFLVFSLKWKPSERHSLSKFIKR